VDSRLLVIEDDDGIRDSLVLALDGAGFDVVGTPSAVAGLEATERTDFDLMLVDLMLGGMDGFTFIRRARGHSDAPIVVVSALDRTVDIVAALEAGADDYVTKPFVFAEVLARVRAMLRRPVLGEPGPPAGGDLVDVSSRRGLVLDRSAGVLRTSDDTIHLTTTEYRLLGVLADHAGRVMDRRALLEQVWSRDFFGDERLVDVHIRRLRRKIEVDPSDPELVATVRGLGYRLDCR